MRNKVTSAAEAVAIVQSGDAICTSGFVGIGVPDALLVALERRFVDTGEPRDLTLLFAAGQGDGKERGLNALGHEGLLKRAIGGHWGLIPKVGRLALEGKSKRTICRRASYLTCIEISQLVSPARFRGWA